jgi:hypothetical protein
VFLSDNNILQKWCDRKIGDSPVGNVSGEKLTRFRARNRTTDLLLNLTQRNRPITEFLHLKIQIIKAPETQEAQEKLGVQFKTALKGNNSFIGNI